MHPFYEFKGFKIKNFPNAKKYYEECISIPCFFKLSRKKQKKIISFIKEFIQKNYIQKVLVLEGQDF